MTFSGKKDFNTGTRAALRTPESHLEASNDISEVKHATPAENLPGVPRCLIFTVARIAARSLRHCNMQSCTISLILSGIESQAVDFANIFYGPAGERPKWQKLAGVKTLHLVMSA